MGMDDNLDFASDFTRNILIDELNCILNRYGFIVQGGIKIDSILNIRLLFVYKWKNMTFLSNIQKQFTF